MKNLDFYNDFKLLSPLIKEQVSLGIYSLYENDNNEFLLIMGGSCSCCHGTNSKKFFTLDKNGSILEQKDEDFYKKFKATEVVRFNLPDSLTKNYFRINGG